MAILIYSLSLGPLLIGCVWSRFRPGLAYLVLSVLLTVGVIVLNPWLNRRMEAWLDYPIISQHYHRGQGSILFQVTRDDIVQVAGPADWRFFYWGICEGGGAQTRFKDFLRKTFRASEATANRYDVSNPTPFMVVLWLLLLAPVSLLVRRRPPSPG